jgi:hypothetical protein
MLEITDGNSNYFCKGAIKTVDRIPFKNGYVREM